MLKTAIIITGGFIICTLLLPPNFFTNFQLFIDISLNSGIYLAFFGPFLSTILFSKGTPMVGTGMASLLGAMELPTAIIMSQFILKEPVNALQYFGILFIIFAISLPHLKMFTKNKQVHSSS